MLLPATRPVTFLPSRQAPGRSASHQEELPNLRASPWCTWTHATALATDGTWKEPMPCGCLLETLPSSRIAHRQQPSTAVHPSYLSQLPLPCTEFRGGRCISLKREMMVLHQEKHEIRLKKARLGLRAQSSEFLILTCEGLC